MDNDKKVLTIVDNMRKENRIRAQKSNIIGKEILFQREKEKLVL
ncbi:hypothetical protein [Clostridium saccharobutylicum]|nr:hypothetical protein [Clostridium saccharobutylicum]